MIGYTTLGTADLERARSFYEAVLEPLGAKCLLANDREAYFGHDPAGVKFAVVVPFDGEPPTVANGSMVALRADNRAQVTAVHAAAVQRGGVDEGAAGPRGDGGFFGGYFRDLDGHKVCVFTT